MDKKVIKNAIIVDSDTGETNNEHGVFTTHEESARRKEFFKKEVEKNEKEKIKIMAENKELRKQCGETALKDKFYSSFIWTYFQEQQNLFPDLKAKDLSRLIFLSTYCDYKTNILVENNVPLRKDDLRTKMNLNRAIYNPWIEKMIKLKYITCKDDCVIINKNIFGRGGLKKDDDNNTRAIRIFIDMIRELYFNLKPDDHHKMGLVLRLIPYINPYFNCLAKNPYEKEKSKLVPLKLGELAEQLGYSQKQCRRLGNDILSIKFGNDSKRLAVALALNDLSVKNHILIFNAKIFFGGNVEEYKIANEIFENYKHESLLELKM